MKEIGTNAQVITYTVPYNSVEIKDSASISTNYVNDSYKENIINKAIKLHLKGNILEARKYYKYCLNKGIKDFRVFSNYGSILKDNGRFEEAEILLKNALLVNPKDAETYSNLGSILISMGKTQKAEKACLEAIKINPNLSDAYNNLGVIYNNLGRSKESESSYRKAISINPKFEEAYSNLGSILRDIGKLNEAKISTQKAIKINPNFANAHNNLGTILRDLGKNEDAEKSYLEAIKINPYLEIANYNLGNLLKDINKTQEAFDCYLKVIERNRKYPNIYPTITRFLRDSDPTILDKNKLKKILDLLLKINQVSHKELFRVFNYLYKNKLISNLAKIDSDYPEEKFFQFIINNTIILNALKKIIFKDPELEHFLTKARATICICIAKNKEDINEVQLQFIIALAEQCFLNEYVYSSTKKETRYINIIRDKCINGEINEKNIAILSCYFPLFKLLDQIHSLKTFKSHDKGFNELIKLQLLEPIKEIELSKYLKKLGKISNLTSEKVKSQYEENPYPRWRYGNKLDNKKISMIQAINNEVNPNYIINKVSGRELKILVAGCGTGLQILHLQNYKNIKVKAIDLSMASLAYTQRKINELEINNVELIQMDLLEVGLLEEKFDIIICSGVLHHMDNPAQGLKALLGVLKPNGYMKLGLYSELARKDIVKARNYISQKKLQPNTKNIRNFRQKILSGELIDLKSLKKISDFYSLSQCRDLCFHAKEHRFTLKQLDYFLKSNKLKFLGFLLPHQVKSMYKQYFPKDKKQTNLEKWAKFEEKNSNTFKAMYQFWVYKT